MWPAAEGTPEAGAGGGNGKGDGAGSWDAAAPSPAPPPDGMANLNQGKGAPAAAVRVSMTPVKAGQFEEAPPSPPDAWANAARMQTHKEKESKSVNSYRSVKSEGENKSWAEQGGEEEAWAVPNHRCYIGWMDRQQQRQVFLVQTSIEIRQDSVEALVLRRLFLSKTLIFRYLVITTRLIFTSTNQIPLTYPGLLIVTHLQTQFTHILEVRPPPQQS